MNKVVLITGASRGIGRATAIKSASQGYDVAINNIASEKEAKLKFINGDFEFDNERDANELKEYIENKYGVNSLIFETDVSNELEVKNSIQRIINRFGRIDVVVNCAGIVFDRDMYFDYKV